MRHAFPSAHRFVAAIAVAALASVASLAYAAESQPFAQGLLWRVSKRGIPDSYVFGTIHIADPRVSAIPKPVDDALIRSRTLALELVPEAAEGQLLDFEQLDDGGRLEPLIGSDAFARLRDELAAQGVAPGVVERLKPWAALIKVSRVAAPTQERSLDEALLAAARQRHLHVTSLELVDEQIAAFDAVPLASQVALLKDAIDHRDALAATIEPTIDAWRRGDLAALARIPARAAARSPGLAEHSRQLAKHGVEDRTVLMHYRLFMPLREGRVFTAIGAAHLYGSRGLLAMLQHDGYRVARVW